MQTLTSRIMRRVQLGRAAGGWSLGALVRLRWVAALGQVCLIGVVYALSDGQLKIIPLLSLSGLVALSNLALRRAARAQPAASSALTPRSTSAQAWLGGTLLVDSALLTIMLGLSGGPSNPFSVLYLAQVTLAALMVSGPWLWSVVACAILGYGALFWWHEPLPADLGGHHAMSPDPHSAHGVHSAHGAHGAHSQETAFSAHLQGMWLALALVATLIAAFVSQMQGALQRERDARARLARQLSLTTLAAGAAHELATPLSTIKVAASELASRLHELDLDEELIEDAELIAQQVSRARQVLDRMALGAGELAGEGVSLVELERWALKLEEQLGVDAQRLRRVGEGWSVQVRWPLEATAQAIAQLVRNALDADPGQVTLTASCEREQITLQIQDHGPGIPAQLLERLGEPFVTTKPAGQGMGLGVFLAHTLVQQLGGQLQLESSPGQGTRVWLRLPREIQGR